MGTKLRCTPVVAQSWMGKGKGSVSEPSRITLTSGSTSEGATGQVSSLGMTGSSVNLTPEIDIPDCKVVIVRYDYTEFEYDTIDTIWVDKIIITPTGPQYTKVLVLVNVHHVMRIPVPIYEIVCGNDPFAKLDRARPDTTDTVTGGKVFGSQMDKDLIVTNEEINQGWTDQHWVVVLPSFVMLGDGNSSPIPDDVQKVLPDAVNDKVRSTAESLAEKSARGIRIYTDISVKSLYALTQQLKGLDPTEGIVRIPRDTLLRIVTDNDLIDGNLSTGAREDLMAFLLLDVMYIDLEMVDTNSGSQSGFIQPLH